MSTILKTIIIMVEVIKLMRHCVVYKGTVLITTGAIMFTGGARSSLFGVGVVGVWKGPVGVRQGVRLSPSLLKRKRQKIIEMVNGRC